MARARKKSGNGEVKRVKKNSGSSSSSTATSIKSNGHVSSKVQDLDIEERLRLKEERENIVLLKQPLLTSYYFIRELLAKLGELIISLFHHKAIVVLLNVVLLSGYYGYITPGPHQQHIQSTEKLVLWYLWWVGLGVMSSVGLGSGLHTFLLYLGPHIAKVTLAAYECNSLNFPEPPYPTEVACPLDGSTSAVGLWHIVSKVRWESLFWGAGTALGELPPYFMARASRLSGQDVDEELAEFVAIKEEAKNKENVGFIDRCKLWTEQVVTKVGFFGILVFASIPNPLFDLAGMVCGHSLVPFWTFFGATLVGKALVKMHLQMLVVIVAFSEHHVEDLLGLVKKIPNFGQLLQAPFKEFLQEQKRKLHRNPGDPVAEQHTSLLQHAITVFVSLMVLSFLVSIIDSLAQSFHKRRYDSTKRVKSA